MIHDPLNVKDRSPTPLHNPLLYRKQQQQQTLYKKRNMTAHNALAASSAGIS